MHRLTALAFAAPLCLAGCAEFPEKYENVIADAKIRPFAIVIDPPEAAPGDTVRVSLKLYDAGKSYAIDWRTALKFQVKQAITGSAFPTASEWIDPDSAGLAPGGAEGRLDFRFVVPDGARNPLRFSGYVPDTLPTASLPEDGGAALAEIGIGFSAAGVPRDTLLAALASHPRLPNALAPLVDGFLALVQIQARVTAPGFSLDVSKNLTVRYSNRLAAGANASNVNANPRLDSIGFIHVRAKDVTDFAKIGGHASDTLFFVASHGPIEPRIAGDTLRIVPGDSYFLIASPQAPPQTYRSPAGSLHSEQYFYQWFYTQLDFPTTDWDKGIVTDHGDRSLDRPVIPIRFPAAGAGLRRFVIRATVGDSRPEWGLLASAGLDYAGIDCALEYAANAE